jgi:hypothetical protein
MLSTGTCTALDLGPSHRANNLTIEFLLESVLHKQVGPFMYGFKMIPQASQVCVVRPLDGVWVRSLETLVYRVKVSSLALVLLHSHIPQWRNRH